MSKSDLIELERRCDRMVALAWAGNRHAVGVLREVLAGLEDEAGRKLVERAIREALDEC